jgi:ATP-dependent DNA helicase RecG
MPNHSELTALLDRLCAEPRETEWLEFKTNRFEAQALGEYLSALANAASLLGKPRAYLVFGIEDGTHAVAGTTFDPDAEKGCGNQPLQIWLSVHLRPNVGFEIHPFDYQGKRVVLFEINPAVDRPVEFNEKAYIRVGTSKTDLSKYPDKERQLWNRRVDWSAQICETATLTDLDDVALEKARKEFTGKFPTQAVELAGWDNTTFLNKAKLTIQGRITNAVLLLLGKPESSTLLNPAVARISCQRNHDTVNQVRLVSHRCNFNPTAGGERSSVALGVVSVGSRNQAGILKQVFPAARKWTCSRFRPAAASALPLGEQLTGDWQEGRVHRSGKRVHGLRHGAKERDVGDAGDVAIAITLDVLFAHHHGLRVRHHDAQAFRRECHDELQLEIARQRQAIFNAIAGKFGECLVHDNQTKPLGANGGTVTTVIHTAKSGEHGDEKWSLTFPAAQITTAAAQGNGGSLGLVGGHHFQIVMVIIAVIEQAQNSLILGAVLDLGSVHGPHQFILGLLDFGVLNGGHEGIGRLKAGIQQGPDGPVTGGVFALTDPVAEFADGLTQITIQQTDGFLRYGDALIQFVEDIVLQAAFPIGLAVSSKLAGFGQLNGFQVAKTAGPVVVAFILDRPFVAVFRVNQIAMRVTVGGQQDALIIAFLTRFGSRGGGFGDVDVFDFQHDFCGFAQLDIGQLVTPRRGPSFTVLGACRQFSLGFFRQSKRVLPNQNPWKTVFSGSMICLIMAFYCLTDGSFSKTHFGNRRLPEF